MRHIIIEKEEPFKLLNTRRGSRSLSLKGIQRAVSGYRVIGHKDRPGLVRGVEGLSSPMIGRDGELEQLKGAVSRMEQGAGGGFAMIFGEAGIGKSRFLFQGQVL